MWRRTRRHSLDWDQSRLSPGAAGPLGPPHSPSGGSGQTPRAQRSQAGRSICQASFPTSREGWWWCGVFLAAWRPEPVQDVGDRQPHPGWRGRGQFCLLSLTQSSARLLSPPSSSPLHCTQQASGKWSQLPAEPPRLHRPLLCWGSHFLGIPFSQDPTALLFSSPLPSPPLLGLNISPVGRFQNTEHPSPPTPLWQPRAGKKLGLGGSRDPG